jgi:CheY-like chemotaxis protein
MPDTSRIRGVSDNGTSRLLAGISVLVIEDHQDTREMFESYLRFCGATLVTIVQDAERALAYLHGQHIDAITTDLPVQPERAVDFVTQVRSRPKYEKTPIIAVSGWTAKSFDPVAVGFTAFLLKPIELDQLVGTIRSLVAVTEVTEAAARNPAPPPAPK